MGWIAVSGFDDTPHRPVNVPTAPYPQYDLDVALQGKSGTVRPSPRATWSPRPAGGSGPRTRRSPRSCNPGPDGARRTDPRPAGWRRSRGRCRRTHPVIPGSKIILYVHGGGSKAEEAVDMANWFIIEGAKAGEKYTVLSLDLPNSAYGSTFDLSEVTGAVVRLRRGWTSCNFVVHYVIAFIEALDASVVGNVKDRIVAVMGGSLGGNTSLLLTDFYDPIRRPYLRHDRVLVGHGDGARQLCRRSCPAAWLAAKTRPDGPGHQPRAGGRPHDGGRVHPTTCTPSRWCPRRCSRCCRSRRSRSCGSAAATRRATRSAGSRARTCRIARSRFDRYEIYTPAIRHWITALDLEQIAFSFQEKPPKPFLPDARLMLVAGDNDNYFPNAIYNSTIEVAQRDPRDGATARPSSGWTPGTASTANGRTCSSRRSCTSWTTPTQATPRTARWSRHHPRPTTRWPRNEQPRAAGPRDD